jgi:hypothetical protein
MSILASVCAITYNLSNIDELAIKETEFIVEPTAIGVRECVIRRVD